MTPSELECVPLHGLTIGEMESAVYEIDELTLRMRHTDLRVALRNRRARIIGKLREARHALGLGLTGNGGAQAGRQRAAEPVYGMGAK